MKLKDINIHLLSADEIKHSEQTTVTKRLRRVSEFCVKQFAEMLLDTRPDECFLNFSEYVNGGLDEMTTKEACRVQTMFEKDEGELPDEVYYDVADKNFSIEHMVEYLSEIEGFFNGLLKDDVLNITRLGTGPKEMHWIDRDCIGLNSNSRYPSRAATPLDFADLQNLPQIENVI